MSAPSWKTLAEQDPEIFDSIFHELDRQETQLELIASENHVSAAVLTAAGSVLTNKYAEGYPGARYYGGCEFVDQAERLAIDRLKQIFSAPHANVQPHSGTQANIATLLSLANPGETILSMSLAHGGHLSHGHLKNFSGRSYRFVHYGVDPKTEKIDFDQVRAQALEHKPKLMMAGASAYPRTIEFARFAEIAKEVKAAFFVDMAHIAGLVAAGLHPSPVPLADVTTLTTHKTLRGPRGGAILCQEAHRKSIDSWIFPGTQGGPLMHVIAAKAVAFQEALAPSFKDYQKAVIENAKLLAELLQSAGFRIVSGGTDNHMMLVDLRPKGISGKQAEQLLHQVGITVNKNLIPFDDKSPMETSGIRIGTPAITTRGLREKEMKRLSQWIDDAITNRSQPQMLQKIRQEVRDLCQSFPIYSDLHREMKGLRPLL